MATKLQYFNKYVQVHNSVFIPPPWNWFTLSTKDHHMSSKMACFCWLKKNMLYLAICRRCEHIHMYLKEGLYVPYIVGVSTPMPSERSNLMCHMLWTWGHPYLLKWQNRFLTTLRVWLWLLASLLSASLPTLSVCQSPCWIKKGNHTHTHTLFFFFFGTKVTLQYQNWRQPQPPCF